MVPVTESTVHAVCTILSVNVPQFGSLNPCGAACTITPSISFPSGNIIQLFEGNPHTRLTNLDSNCTSVRHKRRDLGSDQKQETAPGSSESQLV
ncbi:hypothetical protein M413DRAFT_341848 [Hebeloma cylindrosporum]|uniref:Uncharacterized protein n=1 Tax=Hebeloma cylindrosporum TaxID=76867 RepID=A0A0C3C9I1_HEBCY|nr:hypothetical protein M413DRAFT_341848 [Hebeloma cylindrosporum h7]